jgi:hypothetical protein
MALALPAGNVFSRLRAAAVPYAAKVKITGIKAVAVQNIAGNCLIKVETGVGLAGYGEAGATGPMARGRIETMKGLLLGKDPLAIEVHSHNMTSLMHTWPTSLPLAASISRSGISREDHETARVRAAGRAFPRCHPYVLARHRTERAGPGFVPRVGRAHQGRA